MTHSRTTFVILAIVILVMAVLALRFPAPTQAASPAEIQNYLQGEQYLRCVAVETGAPVGFVVESKISFDYQFGFEHGITTPDQWRATFVDRVQQFTDYLEVPNPTRDGQPLKWCQRLIDAQTKLGVGP